MNHVPESRVAACVNACDGINPEAVPLMLDAIRAARLSLGDNPHESDTCDPQTCLACLLDHVMAVSRQI